MGYSQKRPRVRNISVVKLSPKENSNFTWECEITLMYGETTEVGLFGWLFTIYYPEVHWTYDCKEDGLLYDSRLNALLHAYIKIWEHQDDNIVDTRHTHL